jgi:hypothetical protein
VVAIHASGARTIRHANGWWRSRGHGAPGVGLDGLSPAASQLVGPHRRAIHLVSPRTCDEVSFSGGLASGMMQMQ